MFRWTAATATLAVPAVDGKAQLALDVAAGPGRDDVALSVTVGGRELATLPVTPERTRHELDIPEDAVRELARPVIENAGIKPLPDGSMRDRGTYVTHGNVWQAWDGPDFSEPREVFAVKGGAALFRRSMLESLDFLDPGIFMYYETRTLPGAPAAAAGVFGTSRRRLSATPTRRSAASGPRRSSATSNSASCACWPRTRPGNLPATTRHSR